MSSLFMFLVFGRRTVRYAGSVMARSPFLSTPSVMRLGILLATLAFAEAVHGQPFLNQVVSDDPTTRQTALKKLSALTAEQKLGCMSDLTRMIGEKNGYRVAPAFAKIGALAVPHLIRLIESSDVFDRIVAVRSLGMMRPASAESIALFRRLLSDDSVQREAAVSLLSIGVEDERARTIANVGWQNQPHGRPISGGIPAWVQALSSQDDFVRYDADMLLKNAGAAAVPALLDALKTGDDRLRAGVVGALENMHSFRPDVEAACIRALNDPSPSVRNMAHAVLALQISEAAHDALLEADIAEAARQRTAEAYTRGWLTSTHTRDELLAPLPRNADHSYPLGVATPKEATAPDSTAVLVVIHRSAEKGESHQVLRVWSQHGTRYSFIKELMTTGDDISYLSAEFFGFAGKLYLHLMTLHSGHGFEHEDEFFRVERRLLTPIRESANTPIKLSKEESVAKGVFQTFHDNDLRFEFGIWKGQDPHCCPSATVKGTYTIIGNELRVATWRRSTD